MGKFFTSRTTSKVYDSTTEVTDRFKGLDLVRQSGEGSQVEVCNAVREAVTKPVPEKFKTAKWLSEEAL